MTSPLAPGTIVADRYRVEALLGEGGMGAVYRAEHVHMRKQVALKVLNADGAQSEEIVARFEREAIAAAHIDNPHVVSASDFGKLPDGSFFLVLEYIDGQSLRALADKQGRFAPRRALRIARGVTQALVAAHAKGVVHRDLKPENVMLVERTSNEHELVKVLDFGIAKIDVDGIAGPARSPSDAPNSPGAPGASLAKPLTRIGAVFGTPDYMSPEQAVGQAVDHRTDLYSLGVILYELIAGSRPFHGGTVAVLRSHLLDDVPPFPPEVTATLDPRIEILTRRLLAKVATNRPDTAEEVLREIDALLDGPAQRPQSNAPPPMRAATATLAATDEASATNASNALETAPTSMALTAPPILVRAGAAPRKKSSRIVAIGVLATLLGAGGAVAIARRGVLGGNAVSSAASASLHAALSDPLAPPAPDGSSTASRTSPDPSTASNPSSDAEPVDSAGHPATSDSITGPPASASASKPDHPQASPSGNGNGGNGNGGNGSGGKGTGKGGGHPRHHKEGRRTGPGGIYVPPPNQWFN